MKPAREHPKKTIEVLGRRMAYVEMGEGDPIVYLHGNPTSSYLWRNITPHTESLGRSLAIDLIGMGDSEPLDDSGPGRYRFVEHREYLDAALDALGVTAAGNAVFVVHDWGSALGFDWANRHRDSVQGLVYMEGPGPAGDLGGVAGSPAAGVPGVPFRGGRGHGDRQEHLRRAGVAGIRPSRARPRGDGSVPAPVPGAGRVAAADPHLAPGDSRSRASRPT